MVKPKTLTETAIEFLRAGMTPVEEAAAASPELIGEINVVFTWMKKDYRVSVTRWAENDEEQR